ncbi:MAG: apolipoprotein N-acyltransferase [Ottowia sp.]|nr:apolipoprotein N-acyltransferase [Ottowia sp.]
MTRILSPTMFGKPNTLSILRVFAALLLGITHAQSFAPLNAWWLELLCLAILFWLALNQHTARQASILGWAFGVGWFATGIDWIYISLHVYGHMHAALAIAAVGSLSGLLALFPALTLALVHSLYPKPTRFSRPDKHRLLFSMTLVVASAWSLGEWARGTLFTGFPWLAIGYAHSDGPLTGYAAFIGVYGMSAIAAALAFLLSRIQHQCKLVIFFITTILLIGWLARQQQFTHAIDPPLSVRLLQDNLAQDLKFDPRTLADNLRRHADLLMSAPADLIVAPETAFPIALDDLPAQLTQELSQFANTSGSQLLLGAIAYTPDNQPTNSLLTLNGYRYDKSHLVPFGEFIPWGFRWFVDLMSMPLGDMSSGRAEQAPLQVKGVALAPNICYEDVFGEEIAYRLRTHPAHILLNATNIAWFGNTHAIDQHAQIARLRSLETQLPTLRASNTGATVFIDEKGEIRAQLPPFTTGSLLVQVQGRAGFTPFVRWGNTPLLIAIALILSWCAWRRFYKTR